ncbi:MAG: DUF4373 domain-containing protein [Bacteroidales bacterium]|nr:DUF4373 domain-containing protein [Bacteroidales bacterium]
MPRPTSRGLEYTFLSKDFFNDRKTKRLKRKCGDDSPYVFIALLCLITPEGYYIKYDNDTVYDLADMTGFDEERVATILDTCGEVGLLDEYLMETEHILTSHGIQKYYAATCSNLKRKSGVEEFSLLDDKIERVSSEETQKNRQNEGFPPSKPEETPTKEKKGNIEKGKEIDRKEGYSFSSPSSPSSEVASLEDEKQEEKFLSNMFFNNWAAPNKEYQKFIAFNNTGDRCWAKMDTTQRMSALILWKQTPEQPKRFGDTYLKFWEKVYRHMEILNAPHPVLMHALSDDIKFKEEGSKSIVFCTSDVRDFIEKNLEAGFRQIIQRYLFNARNVNNLSYQCPP